MKFKFKTLEGVNYLVDSKGMFIKSEDGEKIVAPEGTEAFDELEVTSEDDTKAIEELKSYIAKSTKEQVDQVMKELDISGSFTKSARKAFEEVLGENKKAEKGMDIEAIKKGFTYAKSGVGNSHEIQIKTLSELNSLTGEVIEEDRKAGITRDQIETPFVEQLATTGATNSNKVTWVEVLTETGAPATTAELAKIPAKDYTFGVQSADVYKVAVMSKASNEILEDAPQLVSFVKSALVQDLELTFDNLLLSGTGVNQFNGILTFAPGFTGGSLTATFTAGTVNKLDVLRAAIMEIKVAGKNKFAPTAIVLNPADAASLDLEKGTDGHYVMPPFTGADRTIVKGVKVIENTSITAGDFLVGDFKKLHVDNRRGLSLQVATENADDFEKDLISIRLTRRAASYVRTNETGAFLQGDFATAITALEA